MKDKREFDIILWGATSFVGKLVAEYLIGRGGDIRWALAARNGEKLARLQESLGPDGRSLPVLVGDSFDQEFLNDMASRTKVVLTTVGPYLKYGETLLAACCSQGTDYCDLTGEVAFVQSMMETYSTQAEETGARIVNCAGFDSLPSDLGVLYLNDFAVNETGSHLKRVEMQVHSAKGGISGGTIASAIESIDLMRKDPGLMKRLQDPYALCPPDRRSGVRQPSLYGARQSKFNGDWLHQFVMAPVNTKVVHSTNARLDYPYGDDFTYAEYQIAPNALKAYLAEFSFGVFFTAMYFPWTRSLLTRYLPKPGEGPTREVRESGDFKLWFYGETCQGQKVTCRVTGDADPGYGSTAKQISEVALGLVALTDKEGGFWTPASCLGLEIVDPLTQYAGLTFEAWPA
jgi:short subunit dehydrogenase-like uncharacterized protein